MDNSTATRTEVDDWYERLMSMTDHHRQTAIRGWADHGSDAQRQAVDEYLRDQMAAEAAVAQARAEAEAKKNGQASYIGNLKAFMASVPRCTDSQESYEVANPKLTVEVLYDFAQAGFVAAEIGLRQPLDYSALPTWIRSLLAQALRSKDRDGLVTAVRELQKWETAQQSHRQTAEAVARATTKPVAEAALPAQPSETLADMQRRCQEIKSSPDFSHLSRRAQRRFDSDRWADLADALDLRSAVQALADKGLEALQELALPVKAELQAQRTLAGLTDGQRQQLDAHIGKLPSVKHRPELLAIWLKAAENLLPNTRPNTRENSIVTAAREKLERLNIPPGLPHVPKDDSGWADVMLAKYAAPPMPPRLPR